MKTWGVNIVDAKKTFNEIDKNRGGFILFDEFCEWAIKKSLDLEDDEEIEQWKKDLILNLIKI